MAKACRAAGIVLTAVLMGVNEPLLCPSLQKNALKTGTPASALLIHAVGPSIKSIAHGVLTLFLSTHLPSDFPDLETMQNQHVLIGGKDSEPCRLSNGSDRVEF